MLMAYTKKWITRLFTIMLLLHSYQTIKPLSWYSKNDPYPVFTTLDPHEFLYTRKKLQLKGIKPEKEAPECFGFSISPFGQNADNGRNLKKERVEISDLTGRWGLVTLLYGPLPQGETSFTPTLEDARSILFPLNPPGTINDPSYIDLSQRLGYISFPIEYRKRGVRFECSWQIIGDLGIKLQAGLSDICQTVTTRDYFCDGGFGCDCLADNIKDNINEYLVCKLNDIAHEICLDIYSFHQFSAEDFRLLLYWRHAYPVNKSRDEDWPKFLAIPFFTVGGSIAAGKEKEPQKAFSLSFGNNGHHSVGFTAGIDLDFVETIEIGAEAGLTHFFDRDICNMFVPNSKYQTNFYPFKTDVRVSPGLNWHFGAKLAAYHFLDRLSVYMQYVLVQHREDKICLKKQDSAFLPEQLEDISCWKTQLANIGFNYDISPNISLGFLWQAPLTQQNSYRSSTIMFSLNAFF